MPQHDLVQHAAPSPADLRHHRAHRIHVEIQRPQQRQIWIRLQIRHMLLPVERVIHQPAAHVQILAQHFLLVKPLVVAALQPFVEIRNLIQQKPVLVRLAWITVVPAFGSEMNRW